ncbi:hypothetical protein WDZ92_04285 [Nostoc sp. NIES-2111]
MYKFSTFTVAGPLRACRNLSLACLAALSFFTSCKRSSSDPSPYPGDTTGTLAGCKPASGLNEVSGKPQFEYSYDSRGRIATITQYKYSGSNATFFKRSSVITYDGDTILVALASTFPGEGMSTTKYIKHGGKFVSKIGGGLWSNDTTYYTYSGDTLKGFAVHTPSYVRWGKIDTTFYTLSYRDGVPVQVLGNGNYSWVNPISNDTITRHLISTRTFTYESASVVFNPYSPYSIGPGLDIIPIKKMFKRDLQVDDAGDGTTGGHEYSFLNDIHDGKLVRTTYSGDSFYGSYAMSLTYDCQ